MLTRPGSIVLAWAAGWAAAAGGLVAWFAVAGPPILPAVHLPAWMAAGALAFGVPAFVAGHRAGSPAPLAEGAVWTATCALVAIAIRAILIDWYVPEPGEINAVTIEPGQRAAVSAPRLPPGLTLLIWALAGGGFLAGAATGLVRRAGVFRLLGLAATSVGALLAAGFFTIVVAPIVMHIAVGGAELVGHDVAAAMLLIPAVGAIGGAAGGAVMEWAHSH